MSHTSLTWESVVTDGHLTERESAAGALPAEDESTPGGDEKLLHDSLVPRHNLMLQPTPLLGRDQDLAAARQLILSGRGRLVSLTGPPGVGKTRLALAVAAELLPRFPDGVWFVDLALVRDPTQVYTKIAQTLGGGDVGYPSAGTRLRAYRAQRQVLPVLDNFEQVLAAAADVAGLLAVCPGVHVPVTSRARLRLRWERVLPLRPLATRLPPRRRARPAVDHLGH